MNKFKVAVVGDFMQDHYYIGHAERLSPEAPIPVVKVDEVKIFPGGAGNVAANLAELGVHTEWYAGGGTPQKNRLVVDGQQLARWDRYDECSPVLGLSNLRDVDAIVVSDYGKGSITPEVVEKLKTFKVPIFVDTKRDPSCWSGVATAGFPNHNELHNYMDAYLKFDGLIVRKMGSDGLAIYPKGLAYFASTNNEDREINSPARARFVRSVNGAGDTVIAAFVYAYLDQVKHHKAVTNKPENMIAWRSVLNFANAAAAISVEHDYTYAPTLEEVQRRYYDQRSH